MCRVETNNRRNLPSIVKSLRSVLNRKKASAKVSVEESVEQLKESICTRQQQKQQERRQQKQLVQQQQQPQQEQEQEQGQEQERRQLNGFIETLKSRDWTSLLIDVTSETLLKLNNGLLSQPINHHGSLLHLALTHQPPLSIIITMTQHLPQCLTQQDSQGCTPLHIAVRSNCSNLIVGYLAKEYTEACTIKNNRGRTPLHACFSSPWIDLDVVETLVEAAPCSLDVEDEEGMCPLELAIMSESPLHVVKMMQKAKRMWFVQV